MHRDYGLLIMHGPGVQRGNTVEGAAIQDIAPTVLHTMGLPVPADMDGRVLADVFSSEYMASFPVTITQADEGGPAGPPSEQIDYTAEGEQQIIERLEGLGYLG